MSSPADGHRRYSNESDVFSKAETYYASGGSAAKMDAKHRTLSYPIENPTVPMDGKQRRYSMDEAMDNKRKFVIDVDTTLKELLAREDTDKNFQITIDDHGPKVGLSLASYFVQY